MSDPDATDALDAKMFQRIAATYGVWLDDRASERLARQVGPQLQRLRELASRLRADDDMLAFRRLLEREAGRG